MKYIGKQGTVHLLPLEWLQNRFSIASNSMRFKSTAHKYIDPTITKTITIKAKQTVHHAVKKKNKRTVKSEQQTSRKPLLSRFYFKF